MNEKEIELFVKRCASDVPFFANKLLYKDKKELSPKQVALIEAMRKHPHVAAIFNRQGGKTEALAVYDTHELCFGRTKDDEPDNTYVYAPILNQTEIIMGRIHQFFNSTPILNNFVKRKKKYFIEMNNDNTIQAVSASEQSHVRGFSPTKIQIDESQDITDRKYYDDILPSGAATGATIQETGTPKGRTHFYNLTRMKGDDIVIVNQTWEECPFIDREYVLRRKKRMPRDKFNAEFMGKFLTDTNVAFSTRMLDKIIVLDDEAGFDFELGDFYLGGDIGKQDESVFVVVGEYDGKVYQVDMKRLSAFKSYKSVIEVIVELCDEYPIRYGLIDMTGVGEGVVDMLPNGLPVEGMFQSSEAKQDMVDEFLKLGEGEMKDDEFEPNVFLWKDYDLRQQFYEWESKKLVSGKKRYHHPEGSHDDIVIAVLMATKAYADDHSIADYGGGTTSISRSSELNLGGHNPLKILNTDNPYR